MPRKQPLLTQLEREELTSIPGDESTLIRLTSFTPEEKNLIDKRRGDSNKLGFALQLCYLYCTGAVIEVGAVPNANLVSMVAKNLKIDVSKWHGYSERLTTRWEHFKELYEFFDLTPFTTVYQERVTEHLTELATRTDKGIELARTMVAWLCQEGVLVPSISVIERVCIKSLTAGRKRVYSTLTNALTKDQKAALTRLLDPHDETHTSTLVWLRQPPLKANAKHILLHIERLSVVESLDLPGGLSRLIHQNRLLKMAREGGQMTTKDLSKFESIRRYATLAAIAVEARATLIDQIVDLHDRFIGQIFSRAKRTQEDRLQQSSKEIHHKLNQFQKIGQALITAKQEGLNPYDAIENVMPWGQFENSIGEAKLLATNNNDDALHFVANSYRTLRHYAPAMLNILNFKAAPSASDLLQAIKTIHQMNKANIRNVPSNAPIRFIPKRWKSLVFTNGLINRHYYEICALTQLKAALRSGDIYITGSRQFKDFDDYMMPLPEYRNLKSNQGLPISIDPRCESYLEARLSTLNKNLEAVNDLASKGELPEASISESGLRVSPLKRLVPDETELLGSKVVGLLPHIKITDLLAEVDQWTGFTKQFNHLKTGKEAPDKTSLLTTVLADAINLGLSKMSEACPGTTYSKLAWLQAWYVRDETYSSALAEIVNFQSRHPCSDVWGDGTTSSSDGQNFKVGARGGFGGRVNLKYGQKAGSQFYTHISDQYGPYHVQSISTAIRDSTHVLDGLLYHESELSIEEHYTDTAGFTDHVFALTHLLGFRFAPRIRDLNDKRLFVPASALNNLPALSSMIGQKLNIKLIEDYWDDILRLASSIRQGSVTASLILRKLGSYPRQNGLALALREFGRLERTLFMLEWIQSPELRRRVQIGLNKGEARNALARAVFFNQLGEIRDRSFEQQRYRASGLNLVTAAIVLWNTVYLEKSVETLRNQGIEVDDNLLQHISPLGWDHIALTGEYRWPNP